jgi:hypothetical protein
MCVETEPALYIEGTTAEYIRTLISDILFDNDISSEDNLSITNQIIGVLLRDYEDVWEYLVATQIERDNNRGLYDQSQVRCTVSERERLELREEIKRAKEKILELTKEVHRLTSVQSNDSLVAV